MTTKHYHQISHQDLGISYYEASLARNCEICGSSFKISDFEPREWGGGASSSLAYRAKCDSWCLGCWLGVGPTDFPDDELSEGAAFEPASAVEVVLLEQARASIQELQIGPLWKKWPRDQEDKVYAAQCKGDILYAYSFFTDRTIPLIIMPLIKTISDRAVHYPNAITYYPPGMANLEGLEIEEPLHELNDDGSDCPEQTWLSQNNFYSHGVLVFPATINPTLIASADHEIHLELIRRLSEELDKVCLNFLRYYTCTLTKPNGIPARAGQIETDPAMSVCLIYDPGKKSSRIYGGAAFPFAFTGSTGVWLRQPEWQTFPGEGEVGHIVNHALTLYATILEATSDTLRFVQALALLEFLAFPHDFEKFEKVKKVIARYVAEDQSTYDKLLERFRELTGKKDPNTGDELGLRTRIVHIGARIESLIPRVKDRRALFSELDGYIRPVINHMIEHSDVGFAEYSEVRKEFPAFLVATQVVAS